MLPKEENNSISAQVGRAFYLEYLGGWLDI